MASSTCWYYREDACTSDIVSLYPIEHVYWAEKTPFADAMIAECTGIGKTLFLDHEIQSAESDEDVYHECLVHPVMASVENRSRVLVIGGGEGATVREVLRWSDVGHVDWVDIDGALVKACREYLGWATETVYTDPRVTYSPVDIRQFFQSCQESYGVIIIDLPDPDPTDSFTDPDCLQNLSFWHQIRRLLMPGGAFVTHCGPVRRAAAKSGAHWIRDITCMADLEMSEEGRYHTVIPSFQDDWGYWLSCVPNKNAVLPEGLRFLTNKAFRYIFEWAA